MFTRCRLLSAAVLATLLSGAHAEPPSTPVPPPTDVTQTNRDRLIGTPGSTQGGAVNCPIGCYYTYCPYPTTGCCNRTTHRSCR